MFFFLGVVLVDFSVGKKGPTEGKGDKSFLASHRVDILKNFES